jgi:hypothetical protein
MKKLLISLFLVATAAAQHPLIPSIQKAWPGIREAAVRGIVVWGRTGDVMPPIWIKALAEMDAAIAAGDRDAILKIEWREPEAQVDRVSSESYLRIGANLGVSDLADTGEIRWTEVEPFQKRVDAFTEMITLLRKNP